MKSYHEWKKDRDKELNELQTSDNVNTNYRLVGRAFGDPTQSADPKFVNFLRPRIDTLWRFRLRKAEKDNPGSTADPGQIRSLQDAFIKDVMVAITNMIRGADAGSGRRVNFYKPDLNVRFQPPRNGDGSSSGHQPGMDYNPQFN